MAPIGLIKEVQRLESGIIDDILKAEGNMARKAGLAAQNETIAQRRRDIEQIRERMAGNRESLRLLRRQIDISDKLMHDKLTAECEHLIFFRNEAGLKSALLEVEQTGQGFACYSTRIITDRDYFIWGEEKYQLVPGMGVAVFIRTGQRTVLEYLLDPFLDSLSQGFQEK